MAKVLHTEIIINAPLEVVWKEFCNFELYPDWNPFIKSLRGNPATDAFINIHLTPPKGKDMNFRPRVLEFTPQKALRWKGKLLFPGIFDGEHYFEFFALNKAQTRFIQGETFTGILVPLLSNMIDSTTKQGFEAMNEALKRRAEGGLV